MTLAPVAQPDNCPMCGHEILSAAGFRYDTDSHVLIAGGCARHFQMVPWNVIEKLLRRFGHAVDFNSLITAAWGLDEPDDPRKYLNGLIHRLRLKLAGTGLSIMCYRDAGYALVHDTAAAAHVARKAA